MVGQEESAQGKEEQKAVVEEPEKESQFFSKYLGNPLVLRLCECDCLGSWGTLAVCFSRFLVSEINQVYNRDNTAWN